MKTKADTIKGWFRKGNSDLATVKACLKSECYDTACFHTQQAAEKYLKGYLASIDAESPFTHSLTMLVDICSRYDVAFRELYDLADLLTPYAITSRYDQDFWPDIDTVTEALGASEIIRAFVQDHLPNEFKV